MVAWSNNTSCTPPPNCKINVAHIIENKWLRPFYEGRWAFNSPPRSETHWRKKRISLRISWRISWPTRENKKVCGNVVLIK